MVKKFRNKTILISLFVIICFGAWLRLSGVFSNSFSFTYDTGRDLLAVRDMVSGTKFSLIGPTTGKEGIFYGPSWYLILTIPFFFSGGNPQGIVFFIALLGIVLIPLSFVIGKKISGILTGFLFASILSLSPVMVGTSSQIWSPNLVPPLLVVLLFLLLRFYEVGVSKGVLILFAIGILLGLIMDMAIVFGTLLIISVFLFFIISYKKEILKKEFLFFFIGLLAIFSPRILFEFRHNFLMTKIALSSFGGSSYSIFSEFGLNILKRIETLNRVFIETLSGEILIGNLITGLSVIFILFFWERLGKLEKYFLRLIALVYIIFVLVLTFFIHEIWSHYFVGIPILYVLFIVMGINNSYKIIKNPMLLGLLLIPLFYVLVNPGKLYSSLTQPLWEGNAAVYRNQLAVVDYVYKEAMNDDFNYIAYTPTVHDYTWQYLFSWYGKKRFGYSPNILKEKLFFVILEPNLEKPFLLENWLKVREKDGKILEEKTVKGGIIVQKRIH